MVLPHPVTATKKATMINLLLHSNDYYIDHIPQNLEIKGYCPPESEAYLRTQVKGLRRVLVIGGNGYLGSHIVNLLLSLGVGVNATVREMRADDQPEWKFLTQLDRAENLKVFALDLETQGDWPAEMFEDVDVIYFCAIPNAFEKIHHEIDGVMPGIEGIINCMENARDRGIRRIVISSCVCTIRGDKYKPHYNEEIWNTINSADFTEECKIFAERTAWWFNSKHPDCFDLTIFNPGLLLGPSLFLKRIKGASQTLIHRLLTKSTDSLLKLHMPIADVRDTAAHHVMCIANRLTFGQRYILNSGSYWFRELAQTFNTQYKKYGYGMPTSEVGSFMFRVSSWFDSSLKPMVAFYDREMWFDTDKIKKAMNYAVRWRPIGQTVKDMTDEFIRKSWIEDLVTDYDSVEDLEPVKA